MRITRRKLVAATVAVPAVAGTALFVNSQRSQKLPTVVTIDTTESKRIVISNGMPGHATGDFPTSHDPIPLRVQRHKLEMPIKPVIAEAPVALGMWLFGVAVNGIPFDPSGPFWNSDRECGWQFEVLHPSNTIAFGIDCNRAHTQGRGAYHYHGLPTGLLWELNAAEPDRPMFLIGYAGDGFPIYGPECPGDPTDMKSSTRRLRSSYRLRKGQRKDGPKGRFDGIFVEDFEYIFGYGDLDECNGRTGPTPEYPEGTYYYVITDEFPFVPRRYRGKPDPSFKHGPPPGVSPTLPSELRRYQSKA